MQKLQQFKWLLIGLFLLAFGYSIIGGQDFFVYNPDGQIFATKLSDLLTLASGVVVAAIPFLTLGVTVSVIVAVFVDEEWLLRIMPRNRFLSHITISLFGMLMPVCECGNIPLARRLMMKGFTVSQSVTFLMAAPIINAVTILSTYEAFRDDLRILVARIVGGFVIANVLGILMSYQDDQNKFLSPEFVEELCARPLVKQKRFVVAIETFRQEFITVVRMLVIGALIAATIQTLVPQDVVIAIGQNPVLSIIAMMILGFVISICSSIDAFFALSLANTFTAGAITAFLVSGPMVDIKIFSMLKASFNTRTLILITIFIALSTFVLGLVINLL